MCLQPSSEVTGTFSAGNRFPKTVFLVKGAAELDGLHDRQNEGNMPQGANEVELVICVESTIQEVEVCHYNNTDDTLKRTSQQVDLIVLILKRTRLLALIPSQLHPHSVLISSRPIITRSWALLTCMPK